MANVSARTTPSDKTCPRCGATFEHEAVFCAKDGTRLEPEDERPPDSDPYIGTVVSGDIEILSVAGVGAMGRVYRAHQRGIDRDVAVKILHRELSGNTQLVQRFHREAKIASKLQHPHVVEVYLAGQLPDRALYIVMEYLDGMSLGAALTAAGGTFNPARALSIALQICDAVGEGHARGIVHRDLKPENVMLVRRAEMGDWAKVLDFGIAKVAVGEQSMQTAAGLVFGTARYISPEGAQGTNVGPPGDVYSLATIVYQMLAGRTPFEAEPVGLLIKHIHEAPPPLTSWPRAAEIHPALAKVVMDNLAKDPARRAQGARAFGAQLAQAAKEANIGISEVGIVARLSNVDIGQRMSLDPTIDDAVGLQPPPQIVVTMPTPAPTPVFGSAPPPLVSSAPPPATSLAPAPAAEPKRRPVAVIVLAFLLGAALAVLVTQQVARRADAAHDAYVVKTRAALADSRYVTPPGDCVRDLVVAGLAKWPNDIDLLQLRSTASMELVSRAMVAQNGGDVGGARDLARDATLLDPTDHSAALLLSQYDDEVKAVGADASVTTGKPRVLFDALPISHAGKRVDLAAHIAVGNLGVHAKITDVRMTLYDHSATVDGVTIPVVAGGQALYRATLTAPKAGNYDVVFEASLEGTNIRAIRELTVLP
ncbi:MAG TPA: protein kinase [Labilithrix sp.]|nr:protein kinase [Labilithrix sp.]